jgi:Uma2 family endonuclease
MVALPKHKMNVDEFLAWSEGLPKEAGRFELWDGEIIEKRGAAGTMNAERSQHWRAKLAMTLALIKAIEKSGIEGHVAVEGPTVRFSSGKAVDPDVLVHFGPPVPRGALEVPNPAIVVEVLSPSTAKFDLSQKMQGYFTLPSVQHYVVIDPDKPLIIHHQRGDGDALVTRFVSASSLRLEPPGLHVDVTEILAMN